MALDLSQLRRLFGNNSGQRMTMSPPLLELSEEEDERLANLGKIDPSDVSITTPGLLAPDLPEPARSSTGIADSILGRVNQGRLRANKTPFASTDDAWEAKDTGVYMGPTSMEDRIAASADPSVKGLSPDLLSGTGMGNYLLMHGELPRGPIDDFGEPLSAEAARDLQRLPGGLLQTDTTQRQRTPLTDDEEQEFQSWYRGVSSQLGIDPDPDHALHKYDYRGAWKSGYNPLDDEEGHWPSAFKDDDHPNRIISQDGELFDTKTEETVSEGPQIPEIPLFMKDAANQVQEQAGPELPEIPVNAMDTIAQYILANEGMKTESYDDITVDAETKEERSSGWAVGAGQHRYFPPDGGPPIPVEEGMSFTEEELLASADREMKEETVPGIIRLIPEGSWDALPPDAQAQLVSVAWNYGLGSHTFLGENHPNPDKAKMGDRLFTTALREGDWDAMPDAIRALAGDNADKTGYARNRKRRNAEADAFEAAMAGGGTDILGGFRETLSGFPVGEAPGEGMFSSEPHQYVSNIRKRREAEQEAERAAQLEGYRNWLRLPRQRGRQADELTMKTFMAESEIPETISDSPYSSSQRSKDQAEIQRNNDWDDYIVGQADLAAQETDPEKAKIHWQNIEVARKMRQMDTPGAILGTLPGPDIPGMRPTKKTLQDIGGEVTAEHRFQFLEEEDELPEQEDIIGATGEGAADEAPTTKVGRDYDNPQNIDIDLVAEARQAGLLDSRAVTPSAVPGSQSARPQRRGLFDDRLAIAQALAQLSAGVAQGGLFGDITDSGNVRGGLVNVMPEAIKTLRDAQNEAVGDAIPESNWGIGPAQAEQLFYIGPGGAVTWATDSAGNYVLKEPTGTGTGGRGSGGEKQSMARALTPMAVKSAEKLIEYYSNIFDVDTGQMIDDEGNPVEGWERSMDSGMAAFKSMINAPKGSYLEENYKAAQHATGTMGEVFLRLTTGAAYNQQEYGNAMNLFWVKHNDPPAAVLHKLEMVRQFGPMIELMSGLTEDDQAFEDAIKDLGQLREMRKMLLSGAEKGYYGDWDEDQLRALQMDVRTGPNMKLSPEQSAALRAGVGGMPFDDDLLRSD